MSPLRVWVRRSEIHLNVINNFEILRLKAVTVIMIFSCIFFTHPLNAQSGKKSTNKRYQKNSDSFFILKFNSIRNTVKIIPPNLSDFGHSDFSGDHDVFKIADFNADGKKDMLINLGACGTGGCIYGLFLKLHENFYFLAFEDYLKNPEFSKEKNGFLTIESSEEIEPYQPEKIQVTIFKFKKNKNKYKLDTTFVQQDLGGEEMIKN